MITRKTVRCRHCNLNQFVPESMNCRRCHLSLAQSVPTPVVVEMPVSAEILPTLEMLTEAVRLTLLARRGKKSQRQFAALMGAQRTYISKVEGGRPMPTLYTLQRYALAFGISTYELVREIETMQKMLVISSPRHGKEVA